MSFFCIKIDQIKLSNFLFFSNEEPILFERLIKNKIKISNPVTGWLILLAFRIASNMGIKFQDKIHFKNDVKEYTFVG